MKQNREFQYVYKKSRGAHSNTCVLFYLQGEENKVGFTATKKIGNAVVRNRAKRRLRAIFQEFAPYLKRGTFVFVAKTSLAETSYDVFKSDIKKILKKTGGLVDA